MKKVLLFLIFLAGITLSGFLSTQPVKAQGTYTCVGTAQRTCGLLSKNCDPGFHDECDKIGINQCTSQPRTCVADNQPPGGETQPVLHEGVFCPDRKSINTAIGCIPVANLNELVSFLLKWAIGIAGGIAFLLIAYSGFLIITSSGQPDRLKAGQELLTSAISGLILLIFSVFILRIIGVDILGIPGL